MTSTSPFIRNQASELDLGWINQIRVNRNATERRAASLVNRRGVKKEYQAAWLVRAIQCMDLTTLGGETRRAGRAAVHEGPSPIAP